MIGVDLQTFNVQTVIKSCVCVCGVCVCVCGVCVCEREREREREMGTIWYKLWNVPSFKDLIKLLWLFVN